MISYSYWNKRINLPRDLTILYMKLSNLPQFLTTASLVPKAKYPLSNFFPYIFNCFVDIVTELYIYILLLCAPRCAFWSYIARDLFELFVRIVRVCMKKQYSKNRSRSTSAVCKYSFNKRLYFHVCILQF